MLCDSGRTRGVRRATSVDPHHQSERRSAGLRGGFLSEGSALLATCFQHCFADLHARARGLWLFLLRAGSARPLLYRGPSATVIGGRDQPAGRPHGCGLSAIAQGCAPADQRAPSAHLEGRMPGRRRCGVAFSLVTFSCAIQEKVTRAKARKLLVVAQRRRARWAPAVDVRPRRDSVARFPHPALRASFSRKRERRT